MFRAQHERRGCCSPGRPHGAASSREAGAGGVFSRQGGKERSEEAAQEGAALGEDCTWSCCRRRCSATCSISVPLREVEPVEALLAEKARHLVDGGALCNCQHLQAHSSQAGTTYQTHGSVAAHGLALPSTGQCPPQTPQGRACRTDCFWARQDEEASPSRASPPRQRRSPWAATCSKQLEEGQRLPGRT